MGAEMSIECAKCGQVNATDVVLDQTPCTRCGNPLTAFMTDAAGKRISQDEALREVEQDSRFAMRAT